MITVHDSFPSVAVIAALDALIATRGQPVRLSLDNGSEFRSRAFDAWAADRGIAVAFIQSGKPKTGQHALAEATDSSIHPRRPSSMPPVFPVVSTST